MPMDFNSFQKNLKQSHIQEWFMKPKLKTLTALYTLFSLTYSACNFCNHLIISSAQIDLVNIPVVNIAES